MREESKAEKEKLLAAFKIREQEWREKLSENVASLKKTCDDLENQVKRSHEASHRQRLN
jgi:GTP-dependent phosphoenolpyruvate carboxykinase